MAFDLNIYGEEARITLSGEVDLQTTADLKAKITSLKGITSLNISAAQVSYIDSSGIAVLLFARQQSAAMGIRFRVSAVSKSVHRVLEIARLDTLLPIESIVDNEETAGEGHTHSFGVSSFGTPPSEAENPLSAPAPAPEDSPPPTPEEEEGGQMETAPASESGDANGAANGADGEFDAEVSPVPLNENEIAASLDDASLDNAGDEPEARAATDSETTGPDDTDQSIKPGTFS